MNRYVRAIICESWTLVKFGIIKLKKRNNFKYTFINICSPLCEVDITGNGKLSVGRRFKMRSNSHIRVRKNACMKIGDNVSLQYGDMIICHENIKIGNNVQLSPNVLIYDHDHDFRSKAGLKKLLYKTSPVEIGSNVWIGANTVILRGTIIEDNCVIGAGSIVKGHIAEGTVFIQKRMRDNR